jgi:hypothetical protein
MKKFLLGLVPLLALGAFAVAPSAALAHAHHKDGPCRILTVWTAEPAKEKCHEPPGVSTEEAQNLREEEVGASTSPISTNFATQALLVNTKSKVRGTTTIGGVAFRDEVPTGYLLFGLYLTSNPTNSGSVCRAATGSVTFTDVGNGRPSAAFAGTTAWPFSVFSDSTSCPTATRGLVVIRDVYMVADQLGAGKTPVIAAGTLVGTYSEPNSERCAGGGVELDVRQPGLTFEPASEKDELDSGEAGTPAFLCVVASNNYLFPKTAPTWAPFTNSTEKEKLGIWSTKEP